jgi:hypothetical protein
MNLRYHRSRWAVCASLFAALGLVGLFAPAAQAQQTRLAIYTIATDQSDKAALEAARKYFSDLKTNKDEQAKDEALAEGGKAPAFPTTQTETTAAPEGTPPELAVTAVGLPQLTLGDQILAAVLLAKPAKPADKPKVEAPTSTYRWIPLGSAEIRLLSLAASLTDADPLRKKIAEESAKAREGGEPYVHPIRKWILFTRASRDKSVAQAERDKTIEYFLLAREEPKDKAITESDLAQVRPLLSDADPALLIQFNEAGTKRLKDFTTSNVPTTVKVGDKEVKVYRFMVLALDDKILQIVRIGESIGDGKMQVGGRMTTDEVRDMAKKLQGLVSAPKGS